jgi:phenylalanyl-tRNA synthetase beta chain
MKLSSQWIRDFVDVPVDNRRLAEDLTGIGIAVEGISGDGANAVFEMEIGTNRPDAMNHYGVAREAAALYGVRLKAIEVSGVEALSGATPAPAFEIQIEDQDGCARYTAQILRGVTITPSPAQIRSRLALVDQRAINNAADASNYTLWEMGHPTHAFDLDLLEGHRIVVRRARPGETLKTLDGIERKLSPEDLIIADRDRPVALAGVMGGFDSMITEKTRNVLIESAWFDPVAVRKTAKRHGLHTDASHRFERGADYNGTSLACALVAQRIVHSGGGNVEGGQIDAIAREIDQAPVVLRISEAHRILGAKLETHHIVAILQRLGFELVPEPASQPEFSVRIPTWRLDVEREIDLIEEVARLHGYNNFVNTLPSFSGGVEENPETRKASKTRSTLLALGYNEAVSLSFVSNEDAETFSSSPVVELANPLSEEASLMRASLLPGMLEMMAFNLNRDRDRVRLFELGDIYEKTGSGTAEHARICFAATASTLDSDIPQGAVLDTSKANSGLDRFRSLKGDVEAVLDLFDHQELSFDEKTSEYYQPGRSARVLVNGLPLGQFGMLHTEVASQRKLRQDLYVAEINAEELYQHPLREFRYQPLPKYPAVERDFSFTFADRVTFEQMEKAVRGLSLSELRSFAAVEIFRGGSIPSGSYSILLRARFQSHERTLREDEVQEFSRQIVAALQNLGGVQRA